MIEEPSLKKRVLKYVLPRVKSNSKKFWSLWPVRLILTGIVITGFIISYYTGYFNGMNHVMHPFGETIVRVKHPSPIVANSPRLELHHVLAPNLIHNFNRLSEDEQRLFNILAQEYAELYGFDIVVPYLLADVESAFVTNALSYRSANTNLGSRWNEDYVARGIFQIMPKGGALDAYNESFPNDQVLVSELDELSASFRVAMWYFNSIIESPSLRLNRWVGFELYRRAYYVYSGGRVHVLSERLDRVNPLYRRNFANSWANMEAAMVWQEVWIHE